MTATTKTTAGGGTPAVADQKTRVGFTVIIVDVGPAGQCDCDAGIRFTRFGKPYPCPDCADGDHMAECQRTSDYEAYLDRLDQTTGVIQ